MSRSCDRSTLLLGIGFALFLAGSSLPAAPALAKGGGSITVREGSADTTRVREIRIDDEGIRVVGPHAGEVVQNGSITITTDDNNLHRRRFRKIMVDSLGEVSLRNASDNEIVQF